MAENINILPNDSIIDVTDSASVSGKFFFEDAKLSFRKDTTDYIRVNPTGIALTQLQADEFGLTLTILRSGGVLHL